MADSLIAHNYFYEDFYGNYEDYFADAGPEKEQEIIRDFISPAYIAEQLREASLQRQKAAAQASPRGHALCAVHRQARQKLSRNH